MLVGSDILGRGMPCAVPADVSDRWPSGLLVGHDHARGAPAQRRLPTSTAIEVQQNVKARSDNQGRPANYPLGLSPMISCARDGCD
jgi:hypothetical protein